LVWTRVADAQPATTDPSLAPLVRAGVNGVIVLAGGIDGPETPAAGICLRGRFQPILRSSAHPRTEVSLTFRTGYLTHGTSSSGTSAGYSDAQSVYEVPILVGVRGGAGPAFAILELGDSIEHTSDVLTASAMPTMTTAETRSHFVVDAAAGVQLGPVELRAGVEYGNMPAYIGNTRLVIALGGDFVSF